MEETINRRRFVAFAGAGSALWTSGCIGGGEEPLDEDEGGSGDDGGGNGQTGDGGEGQDQEQEQEDEPFDFPPGADDGGVVTETVVAGSRQILGETGRYRIEQTHELNCSDAPRDETRFTDDVDEGTIHERLRRDDVVIDRWVTPDRTVGRTIDDETGRTGRWQTDTVKPRADATGTFESYPFESTSVPSLLGSASLDFERIVTDADRPYAQYAGEVGSSTLELRQPKTARVDYRIESTSGGRVILQLAESGAIQSVEYEVAGVVARLTREGRETVDFEATGHVQFEYDDLEDLTTPEWISSDTESDDVREFGLTETSLGQTYKLVSGPPLPGTVDLEYAEFYLVAEFDGERYIDRYTPRREFDSRAGVVANFDEGELELDWQSISGRDVFANADRIEMSIYLYAPDEGRTIVFHEEFYP